MNNLEALAKLEQERLSRRVNEFDAGVAREEMGRNVKVLRERMDVIRSGELDRKFERNREALLGKGMMCMCVFFFFSSYFIRPFI